MKIIEKKCPNCGATLDFEVGERNVACKSCRRKFAIEYNHDDDFDSLNDSELKHLSAKDFDLKNPLRRFALVFLYICFFAVVAGGVATIIIMANTPKRQDDSLEQFQEESERRREQFEEDAERRREQFEEDAKKMQEDHEQRVEEMKNK